MKIKRLAGLIALVSLLISSAACNLPNPIPFGQAPGPKPQQTIISSIPATQPPASTAPAPTATTQPSMVLAVKEAHEAQDDPKYQIDARWPFLQWPGDPRADPFNQASDAFANNEVQHFKEGVLNTPADPNFKEFSSSIDINFSTTHETNGILSVLLKVYFYAAGAAHPGHYSHSINYDLRQGKVIELTDLLKPGYLDFLSKTCIADLKARNAITWEDGAQPKAENFQVWNITPDGLLITFDEYQVTPYAMGVQTVMIPYSALKDVAKPDTVLQIYLK